MKLSSKINFVLFLVFLMFLCLGVLANYQYNRIQNEKNLHEQIQYQMSVSKNDALELISSLMLNQTQAVDLYLVRIKDRDELKYANIISDKTFQDELAEKKCTWGDITGNACAVKTGDAYEFYYRMHYGNGGFGYLKKVFIDKASVLLSSSELTKFILLLMALYVFVFIVLSKSINKIVINPLKIICDTIKPMRSGKFEIDIPAQNTHELKHLALDLKMMATDLKKYQEEKTRHSSLIAIGQSTAMIAHDVRKPLVSMKALLQTLGSIKDDPDRLHEMIANVDRSISRTDSMLNEVLDFSRGPKDLDLKEHELQAIITSALVDVLRMYPVSNISIRYSLKYSHKIFVDSDRIIRVLVNIFDNAVGAMSDACKNVPEELLFISVIEVDREGEKYLRITIGDSGRGISPEYIDKIFDPFFTKGKKGGTGLGLAICKRVIDMHEGTISAMNKEDGGAEISVELPMGRELAVIKEDELITSSLELTTFIKEEALRSAYGETANILEFLRINKERSRISNLLVVDDEPLFRETIRSLLNGIKEVRDHVKVVEADSAKIALSLFEKCRFDYVIADVDLGKNMMNGYEMSHILLEKYPSAYVIIHSNKRRNEMDEKMRKLSSDHFLGFLPKPMRAEELLQFLAQKTFEVKKASITEIKSNKNVMILNDDDALLISFRYMLESLGVNVLSATSVSEAISQMVDRKVDLILSDVNLGKDEPSGYDFLKHIRENNNQTPFYFVSGYSSKEEEPKAIKLGANGYFQWPIDADKIKELLV